MAEPAEDTGSIAFGDIALGDLVVSGGFFLRGPDDRPDRTRFSPAGATGADDTAGYRYCFSYPGGGSTLRSELLRMLGGARQKVFVSSLLVDDEDVRDALVDAAERLAGGVYVVAALHEKGLDRLVTRADGDAPPAVPQPLSELTRQGIAVRGYPGCHVKLVVVDDEVALVSGADLTGPALDEFGEHGVVVSGTERVAPLSRLFARLWRLSPWDVPPDRDVYEVVSRERGADPAEIEPPAPGDPGPVWTWGPDRHLLQAVRDLVDSATKDVVLATDGIRDMAAKPDLLLDKVRAAAERGVRVRLLVRARNDDRAQRAEVAEFAAAGAEVHADPRHRAKAVVADGDRGLLGSANLAGQPGLTSGVELGMRLDGTPALADAVRYLEHVMAETPTRFVREPTVARLAAGLGDGQVLADWPLPAEVSVVAGDQDWRRLASAARRGGPALFTVSGDEPPVLQVGVGRWRMVADGERYRLELVEYGTSVQRTAEVLDGWLADPQSAGADRRGLCPARLVRITSKESEPDHGDPAD